MTGGVELDNIIQLKGPPVSWAVHLLDGERREVKAMDSKLSCVLAAGLVMFMVRSVPAQLAGRGDTN